MNEDIIVALSTPFGSGGISIVRMSGKGCLEIAKKITQKNINFSPRHLYLTDIKLNNIKDKGLIVYFKAPNSYTGEDTIEIQSHGGILVTNKIIEECQKHGARLAEAGEFSKRAFINGKISLEQSEGIIDVINAQTDAELKTAATLMSGDLFKKIKDIQNRLTNILAEIEVSFDYPDHDIEYETSQGVKNKIIKIKSELQDLVKTEDTGKFVKEGINVAILGKPNVGKSSLLNNLLKYDRAIVTDVAGTTRDIIKESFIYKDIKINLIDTAGIRETSDKVEAIGINKAKEIIKEADIILLILDGSQEITNEDKFNIDLVKNKKVIYVQNKSDLTSKIKNFSNETTKVSAISGQGTEELKKKIYTMVIDQNIINQDIILTNKRHITEIKNAIKNIENALLNIEKVSLDCISVDIKQAWIDLGKITGESANEEIITAIFSRFCLGK